MVIGYGAIAPLSNRVFKVRQSGQSGIQISLSLLFQILSYETVL